MPLPVSIVGLAVPNEPADGWLASDTNFVTRCHNEWFFTRAMYRRVFRHRAVSVFGICCLSALKLTGASLGAVGDLYYLGTGYFSGGVPDGRHFGGTSEPCGHRRPVAVCLLPGQKSGALYRGSGRRRVWRRRAGTGYFTAPCLRNLKRCIIWCAAAGKPAAGQYIQHLPGA